MANGMSCGSRHSASPLNFYPASPGDLWPAVANDDAYKPLTAGLTRRERTVLRCLARGHSMKELARELHLSVHTVKFHIKQIHSKLGVNRRVAAISVALRVGLITQAETVPTASAYSPR